MEREGGPCPKRFERKRKHCGKKEIKERDGGPCPKRFERKKETTVDRKKKIVFKGKRRCPKRFYIVGCVEKGLGFGRQEIKDMYCPKILY